MSIGDWIACLIVGALFVAGLLVDHAFAVHAVEEEMERHRQGRDLLRRLTHEEVERRRKQVLSSNQIVERAAKKGDPR